MNLKQSKQKQKKLVKVLKYKLKCKQNNNKSQLIKRSEQPDPPKIKNRSISFYKMSYKKQYKKEDQNQDRFQFWGCTNPPRKIHVKNPFEVPQSYAANKDITGQSKQLLRQYIIRKNKQNHKTVLVSNSQQISMKNIFQKSEKKLNSTVLAENKKKLQKFQSNTIDTFYTQQKQKPSYMPSTMISDYEDLPTEPYVSQFNPIRQNPFVQKIQQLNQRIIMRNYMIDKIKSEMNTIRYKKMKFFD